jgi:hypothetical protein
LPRIFIGNFEFEHDLAAATEIRAGTRAGSRAGSRAIVPPARARAWIAVAAADDVVLADESIDPAEFAEYIAASGAVPRFVRDLDEIGDEIVDGRNVELVPWGWTPAMAGLAAARGWTFYPPACETVRQVNSRAFRFELEAALGVELPRSAIANSIDDLCAVIATAGAAEGWILKANYGMAGRESVRGRGPSLPEPLRRWARKRIDQTGCVVFEPALSALAEAGIQIEIPPAGRPALVGVTPLLVDSGGTYRGSRFGSPADAAPWQPAIETALRAADRVRQCGYFGPLGIDAMFYRDERGRPRLRPLQDLNARWTMGRLALGLQRILPAGWCASWLHPGRQGVSPVRLARLAELPVVRERRARVIPTARDPHGAASAILVLADSPEVRAALEVALDE